MEFFHKIFLYILKGAFIHVDTLLWPCVSLTAPAEFTLFPTAWLLLPKVNHGQSNRQELGDSLGLHFDAVLKNQLIELNWIELN